MSSQSLYRKWRSQSFDDIIGQDHVVRTLRNAIRHDRVAHAYLFSGPRGTGKTSTARILAKAVNCLDLQDGGPCTRCAMCLSIGQGKSPDVIEIDGASNNSIDDIRVLRERAAFAPSEGRFKVYIIDEVHRLSGNAFDGLLKTLEEPPLHVLFVFASTEPHKLPATILSRCQRFDFHKIDRKDTIQRLKQVAAEENLELDPEALVLIAQRSAGSLRDALGILDQVRAFAGEHIDAEQVRESTGLGRPSTVAELTDHILAGSTGEALRLVHDAVSQGVDPRSLSRQLIEYWRALLLETSGAKSEADLDPALEEAAERHTRRLEREQVVIVLRALTEQVIEPRLSVAPQLPLELAVIQSILELGRQARPAEEAQSPASNRLTEGSKRGSGTATKFEPTDVERIPEGSVDPAPSLSKEPPAPGPRAIREDRDVGDEGTAAKLSVGRTHEAPEQRDIAPAETDTNLAEAWPQVLESVRRRSPKLQALLRDARLMEWDQGEVTLGFAYQFHREQVDQPESRRVVEQVIGETVGSSRRVRCIATTREEASPSGESNLDDTDDFLREAERMLRGVHARQIRSSRSVP